MCALGIVAGTREAGLVVGRDVSVTGYDDIMLAGMAMPALTTVRQPVEEMAATAFAKLRQVMDGGGGETGQSILHRPALVVRDSTSAPAMSPVV